MNNLSIQLIDAFGTACPYAALGLTRAASRADINEAISKAALLKPEDVEFSILLSDLRWTMGTQRKAFDKSHKCKKMCQKASAAEWAMFEVCSRHHSI